MEKQVKEILRQHEFGVKEAKIFGWDPPSIRETVQTFGYDLANDLGFLEMYKDSLGANYGRSKTAFEDNWGQLFKERV